MKIFGPLYDRALTWARHPRAPVDVHGAAPADLLQAVGVPHDGRGLLAGGGDGVALDLHQALLAHGRRAVRVDLGGQIEAGLRRALAAVNEAGAAKKTANKASSKRAAKKAASKKRVATTASNGTRRPLSRNGASKRR